MKVLFFGKMKAVSRLQRQRFKILLLCNDNININIINIA